MAKVKYPVKGVIKNRMKIILASRDMTVKDLSRLTGLHYTTLRRYCSGKQENVNLPITTVICEALGVQLGDIFVYTPKE